MTSTRLSQRLNENRRRSDPEGSRWIRVAIAVLATIGALDTGSITLKKWGLLGAISCSKEAFFGCNGCEKVLASAWGSIAGQPLSLFGFLAYAAVLVMAVAPLVAPGDLRADLATRSWWGLFLVSTGMAVFSSVLVGVMLFGIRDCCPFCILSALLSLALFVLSLVGGDWQDRGKLLFRGVLVALVVALLGLGWAASADRPAVVTGKGIAPAVTTVSTPQAVALAEHLSATGAVMYSAYWCPHCHEQKELFGREATAKLKVIECAADGQNSQKALCEAKKIDGFPSWEINGKLDSGVKPLAKLADLSGFKSAGPL
ncbi:vitamin K epoxide reductase family protein [Cyanobium sp. HWJ4-Hawea]|uniref:vitamin K epoxide reductase family protein n=1 Tax=Cyanobium sp. HWJ4-Hawea TaxID=2823713 RepID=UPI0020CDE97B|nr:vitamin K epoxide reductase family protein [Cyanobium sp. HWJ4-Hawea]MCP9809831.1 vitamin K epoxide reductase family protein [Cyanobium sp. HWJ4-Hawea]